MKMVEMINLPAWYILALGTLRSVRWLYIDIWSQSFWGGGPRPKLARPANGGPGKVFIPAMPLMLKVWIGFSSRIWKKIIKSRSFNVGHFDNEKKVSRNHHDFSNSCLAFWLLGIYQKDQLRNEIDQLKVKNDFLMKFDKAAIILMVFASISWPSLIRRYQIVQKGISNDIISKNTFPQIHK